MDQSGFVIIVAWILGIVLISTLLVRWYLLRRARPLGYKGARAYLRAVPSTDAEKRDATDLALKGAVISLFGVNFFPLLLIGMIPLYYGSRKIVLTLMGMGLVDLSDPQN